MAKYKWDYVNCTNTNIAEFHSVIMAAIKNGGVFGEDFADIFVLKKTPEGSAAQYVLEWA